MPSITVRNVTEEAHAVRPEGRIKLGALLAEIGREAEGFNLEIERDKTPAEPMRFE